MTDDCIVNDKAPRILQARRVTSALMIKRYVCYRVVTYQESVRVSTPRQGQQQQERGKFSTTPLPLNLGAMFNAVISFSTLLGYLSLQLHVKYFTEVLIIARINLIIAEQFQVVPCCLVTAYITRVLQIGIR